MPGHASKHSRHAIKWPQQTLDIGKLPPNYGEILIALRVKRNRTKIVLKKLEAQLLEDTHIIYRMSQRQRVLLVCKLYY